MLFPAVSVKVERVALAGQKQLLVISPDEPMYAMNIPQTTVNAKSPRTWITCCSKV